MGFEGHAISPLTRWAGGAGQRVAKHELRHELVHLAVAFAAEEDVEVCEQWRGLETRGVALARAGCDSQM